jgi:RNA polymerase sigma-B factor
MPDTESRETEAKTLASLLSRYHRYGDRSARERAISMSMPLARRIAVRHYHGREPLDDLVQVAYLALVTAVDRFDPDRGVAFATYAVPTITGELRHHFRDCTWGMHVPRSLQDAVLAVEAARERLYRITGNVPSEVRLARETGLPVERVREALRAREASEVRALDSDPGEDSFSLAERVGREDHGFELAEHRALLADVVPRLSETEREVLALRFIADLKQSEIAGRVGVSQMQISRVLRRVLDRLGEQIRSATDGATATASTGSAPRRTDRTGSEAFAAQLPSSSGVQFPAESIG